MQGVVSAELARDATKQKEFLQIPAARARELLRLPSSSVKQDWGFLPFSLFSPSVNSASDGGGGQAGRWGPRHYPSTGRGLLHGVEDPGRGGDLLAGQCLSSDLGWAHGSWGGASAKPETPQKR